MVYTYTWLLLERGQEKISGEKRSNFSRGDLLVPAFLYPCGESMVTMEDRTTLHRIGMLEVGEIFTSDSVDASAFPDRSGSLKTNVNVRRFFNDLGFNVQIAAKLLGHDLRSVLHAVFSRLRFLC